MAFACGFRVCARRIAGARLRFGANELPAARRSRRWRTRFRRSTEHDPREVGRRLPSQKSFFVPKTTIEGPTFTCADRGENLQLAAVAGGVFYARSTPSNEELMGSQRVRWIRIPPGHKSVGNPAHIEYVTPADRCGAPFELHLLLLRFEVVGGPGGGEVLVETDTRIGEPVGKTFDPPLDMTDVGTVRLTS